MHKFNYDYMKPTYKENINLNYMGTDSCIYDIRANDLYGDIQLSLLKTNCFMMSCVFSDERRWKTLLICLNCLQNQYLLAIDWVGC